MPRITISEPPFLSAVPTRDEIDLLNEYLREDFNRTYGFGEDSPGGDLDDFNINFESIGSVDLEITGEWTFLTHPLGFDHLLIGNIGIYPHPAIDLHIDDATIHFTEGSIDHGSISGLADDDHPQYLLADGTRPLSADWDAGAFIITSDDFYADSTIDFDLLANNGAFNRANMVVDLARINEAAGLTAGDPVYVNGVTGDKPQVGLASNLIHAKAHFFGLVIDSGLDGELTRIQTFGELRDVDTSTLSTGLLHLGDGVIQNAVPTSGAHIHVGWATKINVNTGIIEVEPDQYLHDIRATSDVDVEIAVGSNDNTRKCSFQRYDGTELGYFNGAGLFDWNSIIRANEFQLLDNEYFKFGTTDTDMQLYSNGTQGILTTADDFYLGCGTDKTLVLQETVYNDLSLTLDSAKVPAANAPNWESLVGNLNAYAYQVNDYQEFTQELLHDYKEGSTFQFHIHGALNAALAGGDETVKFEIEYSTANMDASDGIGDAFPATTTINAEFTVPNGTADLTQLFIPIGTDSTGSFLVGATIKGRIRRIASSGTELVGNVFLTQVGIHYEVDTMGSRLLNTK